VPKRLTDEQVEIFATEGFLHPFEGIGGDEALHCLDRVEAFGEETGEDIAVRLRVKAHLAFPWMVALARDARLLDPVEDLIGPDIVLTMSAVWYKPAGSHRYVSWHQDAAYFGLRPQNAVTVWLALTPSTLESGCNKVMPGTHIGAPREHLETWDESNLLWRGQAIRGLDANRALDVQLGPGQFALMHEKLIYGALPNEAATPNVALSFVFAPADIGRPEGRGSAILVRGVDAEDRWAADPEPRFERDPVAMGALRQAQAHYRALERMPLGGRAVMTTQEKKALRAHLLHRSVSDK
jgi:non-heme Fe2+,alpha-ketoglutarate-dependent halogenase